MDLRRWSTSWILAVAVTGIMLTSGVVPGYAGSVDSNGPFTLVTGRLLGRGQAEALFLWSHEDQKLAVYLVTGTKLELLFARDCRFDFEVPGSIGEQEPKVRDVKRITAKQSDGKAVVPTSSRPASASYTLALGQIQGQGNTDALYIWSHAHRRLAVYIIRGNVLELLFSRDCSYDLRVSSLGEMIPPVRDLKALIKGEGEIQETPPSETDGKK